MIRRFHTLALLLGFAGVSTAQAAYVPPSDDTVLAEVPSRLDPSALTLSRLRAQLSAQPQNLDAALAYAEAALRMGRSRADPRYFGYAEAALAPWWSLATPPGTVLVLRATIRQFFHQFDSARSDLDQALAANPRDAQARLTRAVVLMAQGRPQDAAQDCSALRGLAPALDVAACSAASASLGGKAPRALALLDFATAGVGQAADSAALWALTTAAEIAERLGDASTTARYDQALAAMDRSGQPDAYLLAAWADAALQRGDAAAVVARLQAYTDIDNLLLRLALAEQQLGRDGEALRQHCRMIEERFAAAQARGEFVHQREAAMYQLQLARNPPAALQLARSNWAVQREPLDALILLQAAAAAGQPAAATPVREWLQQTGLQDVRITRALKALP